MFCIPKILKNESNSQPKRIAEFFIFCCFVSQRYWKMKAIHNTKVENKASFTVVLYPKDTEKWKQFTTVRPCKSRSWKLFCIPKILKNESNSQPIRYWFMPIEGCFVSQRYWKMKAIHNLKSQELQQKLVVLYPKDTEKWKQFTTLEVLTLSLQPLFCIPKILKNESNSQRHVTKENRPQSCFVSQRYWKMKAIHNLQRDNYYNYCVVLYPKDTEKWKQFTTCFALLFNRSWLFCIPKILKNESNSQRLCLFPSIPLRCFVSQRYWKMKAIHNKAICIMQQVFVVLYPKDTEKWKQFTTY